MSYDFANLLEREKVVEHEHLLNELGIIDRSRISQNDFGKIIQEKKLVLPRYMQPTTTDESNSNVKEDKNTTKSSRTEEEPKVKLRRTEKSTEGSKAKNDEDLMKWITTEPQLPKKVLTEKELNEKCCRLLRNTLPKDLAEKYVKQYQDGGHKANAADENSYIWQRKTKAKNDPPKPRKVSYFTIFCLFLYSFCSVSLNNIRRVKDRRDFSYTTFFYKKLSGISLDVVS